MENNQYKMHILIRDIIDSEIAVSTEDGNKVFEQINLAFLKKENVDLDFQGINILITAFLNSAIGRLYENYNSDFLNKNLKLTNVALEDRVLFKKVVVRAQEYFSNKKGFEDSANSSF